MTAKHHNLAKRRSRGSLAERLWARVDRRGPGDCWVWAGCKQWNGYGRIGRGGSGLTILTHRAAWEMANGPIPEGMRVLHTCDNPPCCNPAHLFLGTQADNGADMARKGRAARLRGEMNAEAKITATDAEDIRRLAAAGQRHKDIALRYAIGKTQVGRIVRRECWGHIA